MKGGSVKKKVLIAVAVLLVVGAVGASMGESDNGVVANPSGQPAATQNATGPVQAKVGAPVTIEGVEVTIKDVQFSNGSEFLKPANGYVWVGYNIQLKALDGSKFISSSDWTALTDGDQQGKWTITGSEDWEPVLSLEELREGATTSGWVVFEVPEPDDYVRLVYDPSFFSDEAKLTFDAKMSS
jgi:hypothetical protein